MKKEFDEEKARLLVKIVPFVLILAILLVTLAVSLVKNRRLAQDNQRLQESIMEYADSNMPDSVQASSESATDKETEEDSGDQDTSLASASASPAVEEADEEASPTPYQEIMQKGSVDYDKIAFDKEEQLKEMMAYWEDSNQEALDDLAALDRFRAMSWKLKGTTDFYYYGETGVNGQPDGTGIAVYADNQYYYGTWKNGVRSGTGTWIHYHVHETGDTTDIYTYHQYTGSWKNDLPDGEGSEHYDLNQELLEENTRYTTNLIGSYSEGLVNGDFYITTVYSNDKMQEWEATGDHGSWVYQNANKDAKGNRTVFVEINDPENYVWMKPSENKNIGVPCLISGN